jgi:tRNA-dihydrouridine synthase A
MHGNLEMNKTHQSSALPENPDIHWSGRFSIAPMLDWTDRHCRYFLRLLSRHTLLYTEMVTTGPLFMARATIWHTAKKSIR